MHLVEQAYKQDETFDKVDYKTNPLPKGEYENCIFIGCDFSSSDLSDVRFAECEFRGCNLSLVKLGKTAFRDVRFKDCKMLGLRLDTCNEFGLAFSFDTCTLNHSSFFNLKIKKTVFKNSSLQEVDFTQTDLSNSVLDTCDLRDATFENTILEKVDLRTAYNYSINPVMNKIKKARFSLSGIAGLLDQYDIEIDRTG